LTASELKRKLAKHGCTFEQGTLHTKVFFQGRVSQIPRHSSKEIKPGTFHAILKQLGIDKKQILRS
jgi:mRNA interferase HicA